MSEEPTKPSGDNTDRLLRQISSDLIKEQRRSRRWGIFFKLCILVYAIALFVLLIPERSLVAPISGDSASALIRIEGTIEPNSAASAEKVTKALKTAYQNASVSGVILQIDSPGGSPVESADINKEILRLKTKHPEIPIYTVIRQQCASGGYYIAVASDKIFANEASLIGSIGVRMDSFGFVELAEKVGVSRRLITAGNDKGFLDPFLPLEKKHVTHIEKILAEVHKLFIEAVLESRKDKIGDNPEVFSGLIWTGMRSLELGLIDGFGDADYVAREVIGAERIIDFTQEDYSFNKFIQQGTTALIERILSVNTLIQ